MDTVDTATRSRMMAAVRSKDTRPEVELRRRLFRLGYRYRLHQHDLSGKPDMVFPKYRVAVFVNGCFWHHHDCQFVTMPATRRAWWRKKLEGNRKHDEAVLRSLQEQGWRTVVVWECSFKHAGTKREDALDRVARRVAAFMSSTRRRMEIKGRQTERR